ncbi:hypothetical protein AAE478_010476 [Parahypoxylon ruwenzoriense]
MGQFGPNTEICAAFPKTALDSYAASLPAERAISAAEARIENGPPAPAKTSLLFLTDRALIGVGTSTSSSIFWPVRPPDENPRE